MKRMTYEEGLELYHDIGVEEGMKEGIEKGVSQSKNEFAMKMLAVNEPIEKIALFTGLSDKEIRKLSVRC